MRVNVRGRGDQRRLRAPGHGSARDGLVKAGTRGRAPAARGALANHTSSVVALAVVDDGKVIAATRGVSALPGRRCAYYVHLNERPLPSLLHEPRKSSPVNVGGTNRKKDPRRTAPR